MVGFEPTTSRLQVEVADIYTTGRPAPEGLTHRHDTAPCHARGLGKNPGNRRTPRLGRLRVEETVFFTTGSREPACTSKLAKRSSATVSAGGVDPGNRRHREKKGALPTELHTLVGATGLEPAAAFLRRKRWLHHRKTGARERAKPESHREGGRGFEPQRNLRPAYPKYPISSPLARGAWEQANTVFGSICIRRNGLLHHRLEQLPLRGKTMLGNRRTPCLGRFKGRSNGELTPRANLAEGVGFEPTGPKGPPTFEAGAIDHSTTLPKMKPFFS